MAVENLTDTEPALKSAEELKDIAQEAGAERRERYGKNIEKNIEQAKKAVSGFFKGLKEKASGPLDTAFGAPEALKAQGEAVGEVIGHEVQKGAEAFVGFLEKGQASAEKLWDGFKKRKDETLAKAKEIGKAGISLGLSGGAWLEGKIAEVYTLPEVVAEVRADLVEAKQGLIELKEGLIAAFQEKSREKFEKKMNEMSEKMETRVGKLAEVREVAVEGAAGHRQNAEAYKMKKPEVGFLRKLNKNKGIEQ